MHRYFISNISNAWGKTSSVWGKIAVVLFFGLAWIIILANVVGLWDPLKDDVNACVFTKVTDLDLLRYILTIFRLLQVMNIVFFLYAQHVGMTLANLLFVFGVWIVVGGMFYHTYHFNQGEQDCLSDFMKVAWLSWFWQVVGIAAFVIDSKMPTPVVSEQAAPLVPKQASGTPPK
jgi:hypothetical protein